ncbi:hypothetical protein BJ322DRAFT_1013723 [Thelephora terrestris]|uniref:Ion transport domain-containing protein n=1 Tax=Thelephora terrestris TaxID=56493 RepID=A0A9P6H502_9AGAM|nr:hypothetical protein BJ322DRAFT_1013723 [Thelephora terrestris]
MEQMQPLLHPEDINSTSVWPLIHMIRAVYTPLSYEALTAPDLTYTLVRPLEEKYNAIQRQGNKSVVFCLLLNRVRFYRDQNLMTIPLSRSRATFCEILAIRTMRIYADSLLDLALAITTNWPVYMGCDPNVLEHARQERDDDLEETVGNAIELAIISKAKLFIKSSPCQKVIDAIWSGRCVYQARGSHSLISDTYKRTPIHFYDPHKAPLLDHYRLKVPAIRSVLEYLNYLILFVFFIIAIERNNIKRLNAAELTFMIYASGFTLERIAAMQEHGIRVFFKGTWNGFDLAFVSVYWAYLILRVYGVYTRNKWAMATGIDLLAVISCVPLSNIVTIRLAFVTLRNNLMVLSLRAMLVQFVVLMIIAAFCFAGFLYALWTQIAWWMLDLYFGLDAAGFDRSTEFHHYLGPIMMVTYACLSNTLLLTVLVSILTNTFATINEDAAAEAMFRKAVSTIEGVKADFLFSYQPPINMLALCIMLPASRILSPRWFHKAPTSFPILLCIAWYERQAKSSGSNTFYETIASAAEKVFDTLPRRLKRITIFEGLAGVDADIDAIFEIDEDHGAGTFIDRTLLPPSHAARQRRLSQYSYGQMSDTPDKPKVSSPPAPTLSISPPEREPTQSKPADPAQPEPIPQSTGGDRGSVRLQSPSTMSDVPLRGATRQFQQMRPRLNSLVNPANSSPSPLALLFQPIVVEEEAVSDDHQEDYQNSMRPPNLLSYGPASRRRLVSVGPRRRGGILTESSPATSALARWQSQDPGQPSSSPGRSDEGDHFSRSPDPINPSTLSVSETAAQVLEEEENEGGETGISRRLEMMEERQKRIEEMLLKLTHHLS